MFENLPVEFFGEHNQVLALARKVLLVRVPGIPDSRLAHEIEPRLMDYSRNRPMGISPEEDRGAEDTLEGAD